MHEGVMNIIIMITVYIVSSYMGTTPTSIIAYIHSIRSVYLTLYNFDY